MPKRLINWGKLEKMAWRGFIEKRHEILPVFRNLTVSGPVWGLARKSQTFSWRPALASGRKFPKFRLTAVSAGSFQVIKPGNVAVILTAAQPIGVAWAGWLGD